MSSFNCQKGTCELNPELLKMQHGRFLAFKVPTICEKITDLIIASMYCVANISNEYSMLIS